MNNNYSHKGIEYQYGSEYSGGWRGIWILTPDGNFEVVSPRFHREETAKLAIEIYLERGKDAAKEFDYAKGVWELMADYTEKQKKLTFSLPEECLAFYREDPTKSDAMNIKDYLVKLWLKALAAQSAKEV